MPGSFYRYVAYFIKFHAFMVHTFIREKKNKNKLKKLVGSNKI